jgi:hypothetical protein
MTKQIPQGIRAYKPNEAAPSWIKANLEIDKQAFITWLSDQPKNQIKLEVKESKKQTLYVDVYTSNKDKKAA